MAFNFENYITPITGGASGNPNSPLSSGNISNTIGLSGTGDPSVLYTRLVTFFTWGLGVVAVLILIYGGFLYITAGGESEKAEKGKKTIFGAAIGIIVIMISYAVYNTSIGALNASNSSNVLNNGQLRNQLDINPSTIK